MAENSISPSSIKVHTPVFPRFESSSGTSLGSRCCPGHLSDIVSFHFLEIIFLFSVGHLIRSLSSWEPLGAFEMGTGGVRDKEETFVSNTGFLQTELCVTKLCERSNLGEPLGWISCSLLFGAGRS